MQEETYPLHPAVSATCLNFPLADTRENPYQGEFPTYKPGRGAGGGAQAPTLDGAKRKGRP